MISMIAGMCWFLWLGIPGDSENILIQTASTDAFTRCRTQYKIGTEHFKKNKYKEAWDRFNQNVQDPQCPITVKALSWNMMGQICRIKGKSGEALGAFEAMVKIMQDRGEIRKEFSNAGYVRLLCLVMSSRAEILETQKEDQCALEEYERLLTLLGKIKPEQSSNCTGSAAVLDRMSQCYLRQKKVDQYITCADKIIRLYPEYDRLPLVKLELACIKYAKKQKWSFSSVSDSYVFPAQVIGSLGRTCDSEFVNEVKKICDDSKTSRWSYLIEYHYGWLLEFRGDFQKATGVFASLSEKKKKHEEQSTLMDYAKIEYAVLLSEQSKYKQALGVLNDVHPAGGSHVSKLVNALKQNLQMHMREAF